MKKIAFLIFLGGMLSIAFAKEKKTYVIYDEFDRNENLIHSKNESEVEKFMEYDKKGRLVNVKTITNDGVIKTYYEYDSNNNCMREYTTEINTRNKIKEDNQFEYNSEGVLIKSVTKTSDGAEKTYFYEYDENSKLIKKSSPDENFYTEYKYDEKGVLESEISFYYENHKFHSSVFTGRVYDESGRVTQYTFQSSLPESISYIDLLEYKNDYLVSVRTRVFLESADASEQVHYEYDDENRLVKEYKIVSYQCGTIDEQPVYHDSSVEIIHQWKYYSNGNLQCHKAWIESYPYGSMQVSD